MGLWDGRFRLSTPHVIPQKAPAVSSGSQPGACPAWARGSRDRIEVDGSRLWQAFSIRGCAPGPRFPSESQSPESGPVDVSSPAALVLLAACAGAQPSGDELDRQMRSVLGGLRHRGGGTPPTPSPPPRRSIRAPSRGCCARWTRIRSSSIPASSISSAKWRVPRRRASAPWFRSCLGG